MPGIMSSAVKIRRKVTAPVLRLQEGKQGLRILESPLLAKTGLVKHGFSTRFGGVSTGIYESMNLSFTRGDREEAVQENYRRMAEFLSVPPQRFVLTYQTHTDNIRVVTEADAGKGLTRPRDYGDVDGLISNVPELCLGVFWADCVPILLLDPVHRAVGAVHSGWRGTVQCIGAKAVAAMGEAYGTRPEDVLAVIGPSICRDCYEISEDVALRFREAFPKTAGILTDKGRNAAGEQKYLLDLWAANRAILLSAGLRPENLECTDICTCCNPELMFSHRAAGDRRGNNGAFIALVREDGNG